MENKNNNGEWEKIKTASIWDFKNDVVLIGYYIGVEREIGPNKSNLYTFRKDEDSELIAVWGNTILDNRFKGLLEGEKVKVVYNGMAKSPKSGREYHDFEVYQSTIKKVKEKNIPVIEDTPLPEEE